MSSILTNNSAMVALQTLKMVNSNLTDVQKQISTGKEVADAADNSAVYAISKVMESDKQGFTAISDSLSLGESTVAVARNAAETTTDLLVQMKEKIVAAQGDSVDRDKLQEDVVALRDQIKSVTAAAQFNGINLVDGSVSSFNTNGNLGIDILSSLDRDSAGGVTISNIGVNRQDLSTTAGATLTTAAASLTGTVSTLNLAASDGSGGTGAGADFTTVTVSQFLDASGGATGSTALNASDAGVNTAVDTGFVAGDVIRLQVGDLQGSYTIKAGDNADAVAAGLKNGLAQAGRDGTSFADDFTIALGGSGTLTVENNTNTPGVSIALSMERGTGALSQLETIDVTSDSGAATALGNIEGMIQSSIDAAASFGSVQGRIETQSDFVSKLTDSFTSGIGSLVDTDMEDASARLQALQTQQQLAVQSLSIANQAPSAILQLFR